MVEKAACFANKKKLIKPGSMDFLRHIAKEYNKKTGSKAGSFSCTRVFLTGCFPAGPVSAFTGVVKMSKIEKLKNDF